MREAILRWSPSFYIRYIPQNTEQDFLIVLCLDLEIALCVLADWANLRSLLSDYNVAAV